MVTDRSLHALAPPASIAGQPREVAAHERLAAGQPHVADAHRRQHAHDPRDLLEAQDLVALEPRQPLGRHAVLAAEVAAVGDRDAHVADQSSMPILQRLDRPSAPRLPCGHAAHRYGRRIAVLRVLALSGCGTDPTGRRAGQDAAVRHRHGRARLHDDLHAGARAGPDRAPAARPGSAASRPGSSALGRSSIPYLSVGKITVKGSTATVIVLSVAQGQRSSLDAIGLIKTGAGWRIDRSARNWPTSSR